MKTVTIAGKSVEIYDDIESLPMVRFHKYNKLILIEGHIGSDLQAFDVHIEKAMIYISSGQKENALAEMNLLRQNFYLIQEQITPDTMAFAALVKSIDGNECTDISDEGLKKTQKVFSEMSLGSFTDLSDSVKKKIDGLLQLYFPEVFDDAQAKEYFNELLRRTKLILMDIINDTEDNADEVQKITDELMTYSKPAVFTGKDSIEINHDKSFENLCLSISQYLHADAKKYTVLEFYNSLEYVKAMHKAQAAAK
jgi:hypothetical protein